MKNNKNKIHPQKGINVGDHPPICPRSRNGRMKLNKK